MRWSGVINVTFVRENFFPSCLVADNVTKGTTMKKCFYQTLLALTLLFPSSVNAKPRVMDVTIFDVAGVKLGMTPAEARQALTNKGFHLSDDFMYLSWSAQVAAEAGKYANTPKVTTRAIWETKAEGADYQTVWVRYEINVNGSRVKEVKYTRPARLGNILKLADERYGPPTRSETARYRYCPEIEGCPKYVYGNKTRFPSLEVYHSFTDSGHSEIILTQGTTADQQWDAKFRAAVIAIAPNYGKAAF